LLDFNGRRIDAQQAQINSRLAEMQALYTELERKITNAVGTEALSLQRKAMEELAAQQRQLLQAVSLESGRKKPDKGVIADYENKARELGYKIEDIIKQMADDLMQGDIKTLSGKLAEILASPLDGVVDKMTKVKELSKGFVKDILLNWIQTRIIEDMMKEVYGNLQKRLEQGGPTQEAWEEFYAGMDKVAEDALKAIKPLQHLYPTGADVDKQLANAFAAASEQTVNAAVGLWNAIHHTGTEHLSVSQSQLQAQREIAADIAVIRTNSDYLPLIYNTLLIRNTDQAAGKGYV
jgi:hypothetical protein